MTIFIAGADTCVQHIILLLLSPYPSRFLPQPSLHFLKNEHDPEEKISEISEYTS